MKMNKVEVSEKGLFAFAILYAAQSPHWCTTQGAACNTCTAVQLKCHVKHLFLLLHIMNLNFTRLEMRQQLLTNSTN